MNQRTSKEKGLKTQRNIVKENKKLKSGNKRNVKDVKVLAERNPAAVAPVGIWVENGHECEDEEHPEIRALLTEELLEETRREKEENLRRFQDAVRKRLSQQARLRKHQLLLKSYETVESEAKILHQTSKVTQHLMPQKNPFPSWAHGELAICSPNSRHINAQGMEADASDQHTHNVSKVMKHVRHRLAACQTVQEADELSQLPGGIWKTSPTRDNAESHTWRDKEDCTEGASDEEKHEQEAEEEITLVGQHDQPSNLHHHRSKKVTFQNDMVYEPYLTGSSTDFKTDYRASQVLWPHKDQEEMKKQRQSQFLMYRRLFMNIERECVKEHQKHRKHLKRTARIKNEKEQLRKAEEIKMEGQRRQEEERKAMAERECLILERLRLDEEEAEEEMRRRQKTKKGKETQRYTEAMRALMKEKLKDKVNLPPLCCCGDTFWDTHPDTCANNCVFYNNPKVYEQALQSVLLSCDLKEGGLGQYASTWKTHSMF